MRMTLPLFAALFIAAMRCKVQRQLVRVWYVAQDRPA
jgi:hypothetical protein